MKAFSPKSKPETQQANQERKRPTSHETAPSRVSGFVDNRPEAIAQRKLQAMMNRSPQVQPLAQLRSPCPALRRSLPHNAVPTRRGSASTPRCAALRYESAPQTGTVVSLYHTPRPRQ